MTLNVQLSPSINSLSTSSILVNCASVGSGVAISYGENLLTNGDFNNSVAGVAGPGWFTDYLATGVPGTGVLTFQPTQGPDGSPCWYADVSTILTSRIFYWNNIYLINNQAYQISMSLQRGGVGADLNVAIKIDGGAAVATLIGNVIGAWQTVTSNFVFTGATGFHTVAVTSNSAVGFGNDGRFDFIGLRPILPAVVETRTLVSSELKSEVVIDQSLEITDCDDNDRDIVISNISQNLGKLLQNSSQVQAFLVRQTNVGTQTIAAGARSVSVSVVLGSITANVGSTGNQTLTAGQSLAWRIEDGGIIGENLKDNFVFTGILGSDFYVLSTREN